VPLEDNSIKINWLLDWMAPKNSNNKKLQQVRLLLWWWQQLLHKLVGMDEVVVVAMVAMSVKVMVVEVGKAKEVGLAKVQVAMGKAETLNKDKEVAWSDYF
jgi:hypothetical protein